jgi:hypothetical protein
MNALAIFDPQAFDIFGAYQQGREAHQGNALRQFMAQNGEGLINGDPAVMAQLAQYDPMMAFELQRGMKQDQRADKSLALQERGFEADQANRSADMAHRDRSFEADQAYRAQSLELARAEGVRQAKQHGATMKAHEREGEIAALQTGVAALAAAMQQGPDAVAMVMQQWGDDLPEALRSLPPDQLLEFGKGMLEGLSGDGATDGYKTRHQQAIAGGLVEGSPEYQRHMLSGGEKPPQIMGTPPAGYRITYDDNNNPIGMEPMAGSPAALEAEAAAAAAKAKTEGTRRTADIVIEDIGRAKKLVEGAPWFSPATGMGSSVFKRVGGTNAADLRALTDTISANIGFDRLQQMRDQSPTGGALGAVSQREMDLLASVLGSLEQSQSEPQMVENLERLNKVYNEIIHGPGGGQPSATGAAATSSGVNWRLLD